MPKLTPATIARQNKLKALIREVKEKGLLDYKFADTIAKQLGVNKAEVYKVSAGNSVNPAIVDAILKMAESNKLEQQIAKAKQILDHDEEE